MRVYTTRFERINQDGFSVEYKAENGYTVAYLDEFENDKAEVAVFDSYNDSSRNYSLRPVDRARNIIERHIEKMGFVLAEDDEE